MALRYFVVVVVALLCVQAVSAFRLNKRALASNPSEAEGKEICQGRTPCGWAVYTKVTRYIDYFMKNKCDCGKGKRCLRDDDDISITAYVYRCKSDDSTRNS